jgi:two-component system, cell cycle sensor histidine kinase and response regulator CckA
MDAKQGQTILLVEDDDAIRALVARVLSQSGYQVFQAANAEDALTIAAGHAIDTLITDCGLPGMSGEQLAEKLHLMNPAMRIVIVSGYDDDRIAPNKWTAFLRKPFTPTVLLDRLRRVSAA